MLTVTEQTDSRRAVAIGRSGVRCDPHYLGRGGNYAINTSQVFNKNELKYLVQVYKGLLNQSLQNIDELTTIITANKLSMSDDERLKIIDRIYEDTSDKLQFLKSFNRKTNVLMMQRNQEKEELQHVQNLYQINK